MPMINERWCRKKFKLTPTDMRNVQKKAFFNYMIHVGLIFRKCYGLIKSLNAPSEIRDEVGTSVEQENWQYEQF